MCLYPRLIKNPKYLPNKKNGGVVATPQDPRVISVPIGCGQCIECRKKKYNEWKTRLLEEVKKKQTGLFVTLTFNQEKWKYYYNKAIGIGYQKENNMVIMAVRDFMNKWRKINKKALRHWFITELGHTGTERIHIHGIVWHEEYDQKKLAKYIEEKWQNGYVWLGRTSYGIKNYVNERTINYITKYMMKVDRDHPNYKSIILASKGIGKIKIENYPQAKFNGAETKEYIKDKNGFKRSIPKYYRNQIYTEAEREALWLHRLDKNERYILGQKVNADDYEKIHELRKIAQEKNKRLGYGSPDDWTEKEYEETLREHKLRKQNNKNAFGDPPGGFL